MACGDVVYFKVPYQVELMGTTMYRQFKLSYQVRGVILSLRVCTLKGLLLKTALGMQLLTGTVKVTTCPLPATSGRV